MQNPCEKCKKKPFCRAKCFPRKDFDKSLKKKWKR